MAIIAKCSMLQLYDIEVDNLFRIIYYYEIQNSET
jgi:hypothetical protein